MKKTEKETTGKSREIDVACATQTDLKIQCYLDQNSNVIFHWNRKNNH